MIMIFLFLKLFIVFDVVIGEFYFLEFLNFCFDLFFLFLFEFDLYLGKIYLIICIVLFCREIIFGIVGYNGLVVVNLSIVIVVGFKVFYSFFVNLMCDIGVDWDIDYDFDVGVKFKFLIIYFFIIFFYKKGMFKLLILLDIF